MDKFRRAFSATKMAQQDSNAAASNNNGQAIESLAKSSSNTFGIPVRLQFNPTSMFKFRTNLRLDRDIRVKGKEFVESRQR